MENFTITSLGLIIVLVLFLFKEFILSPTIYKNEKINEKLANRINIYRNLQNIFRMAKIKGIRDVHGFEDPYLLENIDKKKLVSIFIEDGYNISPIILNYWYNIVEKDSTQSLQNDYSRPNNISNLIIEAQELVNVLDQELLEYQEIHNALVKLNLLNYKRFKKNKIKISDLIEKYSL